MLHPLLAAAAALALTGDARAQAAPAAPAAPAAALPELHHVGLNSVDPDRAIGWYRGVFAVGD